MLIILILVIFNLSAFNIPSDKSFYQQSENYFSATEKQYGLARYQQNDIGMGMTSYNNDMILLKDVQPAYKLLISEMEKAEKNINMELYIIHNDETGKTFKNILIKKARQGVEVRLLYDAWGSALTSQSYFNDMRKNGVKVTAYNPLLFGFFQGRLGNRLHRKMLIIDGQKAFIGGENIGDEYLGKDKKLGFWKDTGIFLNGEAARSVQQIFLNDWLQAGGEKMEDNDFYPKVLNNLPKKTVKIILGGPDTPLHDMSKPYLRLITKAKKELLIVSPYFFPNTAILKALYQAADHNIDITVIIPSKSDNKIAQYIQPIYIKKLLAHGIKVTTNNQEFIHSKVMIVDNNIASIGTANLNRLSFTRSYEVSAIIYDKKIIQQLKNDFQFGSNRGTFFLLDN